jgi:hypothetical protein
MPAQTEAQRKATAQKAAATRRRNAANRKRSAQKAAETRAKAEMNAAQALAREGQSVGQRALDLSVGAALEVRDRVVGAARPIADASERRRVRRSFDSTVRRAQRRGAKARRGARRSAEEKLASVRP